MFSFLSRVLELSANEHSDNALRTIRACSTTSSRLANLNIEDWQKEREKYGVGVAVWNIIGGGEPKWECHEVRWVG